MLQKPLFQQLASLVCARQNCIKANNTEWLEKHTERLEKLVSDYMPSGSGIDCGTKLDLDNSTEDKLVFTFSFHHMDENGMYCGWTEHKAIVTPSLQFGYHLKITGRDKNGIKEYLHETISFALDSFDCWIQAEYDRVLAEKPEFKIDHSWDKDGCTQTWFCKNEQFKTYRDAEMWAIRQDNPSIAYPPNY